MDSAAPPLLLLLLLLLLWLFLLGKESLPFFHNWNSNRIEVVALLE